MILCNNAKKLFGINYHIRISVIFSLLSNSIRDRVSVSIRVSMVEAISVYLYAIVVVKLLLHYNEQSSRGAFYSAGGILSINSY